MTHDSFERSKLPPSYIKFLLVVIVALCTFQSVRAADDLCVRDQAGLRQLVQDNAFPNEWIETTADDGKPLVLKMSNKNEKLYFVFDKTKEGVWAEGPIEVCKSGEKLLVKISGQDIKVGSEAPRLIRWSMSGGATFRLQLKSKELMHVSITGWSGDFIPHKTAAPAATAAVTRP